MVKKSNSGWTTLATNSKDTKKQRTFGFECLFDKGGLNDDARAAQGMGSQR